MLHTTNTGSRDERVSEWVEKELKESKQDFKKGWGEKLSEGVSNLLIGFLVLLLWMFTVISFVLLSPILLLIVVLGMVMWNE